MKTNEIYSNKQGKKEGDNNLKKKDSSKNNVNMVGENKQKQKNNSNKNVSNYKNPNCINKSINISKNMKSVLDFSKVSGKDIFPHQKETNYLESVQKIKNTSLFNDFALQNENILISIRDMFTNPDENIDFNANNIRILKLSSLLDVINQTYKVRNARLEAQKDGAYFKYTLEHDLYSYLKKKYGLKKLIIEWSVTINESIKSHGKSNAEVYLFCNILQNKLDEYSIDILSKIKSTLDKILNIVFDYKNSVIKRVKGDRIFIKEKEWMAIIEHLYSRNGELKESFIKKVVKFIDSLMDNESLVELTGKQILFSDFENLLILFNIDLRKKYLSNFYKLFSNYDPEHKGIINHDEFYDLLKTSGLISEANLSHIFNTLIEEVDKEGTGYISYTDAVNGLQDLDVEVNNDVGISFLEALGK